MQLVWASLLTKQIASQSGFEATAVPRASFSSGDLGVQPASFGRHWWTPAWHALSCSAGFVAIFRPNPSLLAEAKLQSGVLA